VSFHPLDLLVPRRFTSFSGEGVFLKHCQVWSRGETLRNTEEREPIELVDGGFSANVDSRSLRSSSNVLVVCPFSGPGIAGSGAAKRKVHRVSPEVRRSGFFDFSSGGLSFSADKANLRRFLVASGAAVSRADLESAVDRGFKDCQRLLKNNPELCQE
jgi:hypothetical protein